MKHWLLTGFLRHELWALNWADRMPVFGMLFGGTLFLWALPCAIVLAPLAHLMVNLTFGPLFLLISLCNLGLAMALLFYVAPWFFGWYGILAGLMFGNEKAAERKRAKIETRLAKIAQAA